MDQPPTSATPTTPPPSEKPAVTTPVPPTVPTATTTPPVQPAVAPPAETPPPAPVPGKKKLPFLGIGIVIILLLTFVGGIMYLRQTLYKEINKHADMSQEEMADMKMNTTTPHEKMAMDMKASHLLNEKVLLIGSDTTFQPMEYVDQKGQIVGYSVDLGKEIAKEMGVTAEVKTIVWDDIFKALDNKEIDVVVSSVSITDERKKKYEFSDPYLNAGQVILTRKDTTTITKPTDLEGKKVGAQKDTTSIEQAEKYGAQTISYPDPDLAITDLVKGKVDAVIADLPAAKGYTDKNPTLTIASDPFTSEYYGIVFRKGDTELRDHMNQILNDLQQKGVLADLKEKWLE